MNLVSHHVRDDKEHIFEVDTLRNKEVRLIHDIFKENSKLKWEIILKTSVLEL